MQLLLLFELVFSVHTPPSTHQKQNGGGGREGRRKSIDCQPEQPRGGYSCILGPVFVCVLGVVFTGDVVPYGIIHHTSVGEMDGLSSTSHYTKNITQYH